MGDLHRLVLLHGKQAAREMVGPSRRRHVDIAAEVLADEAQRIGITYSGFCLTGFPHKRLGDDAAWEKNGHNVTLLVEQGGSIQGVAAVYQWAEFLAERKAAIEAWAAYVTSSGE